MHEMNEKMKEKLDDPKVKKLEEEKEKIISMRESGKEMSEEG